MPSRDDVRVNRQAGVGSVAGSAAADRVGYAGHHRASRVDDGVLVEQDPILHATEGHGEKIDALAGTVLLMVREIGI